MKLVSLPQLNAIVKAYLDQDKIANPVFSASKESLTGLVNKIFAEVFLDGDYEEGLGFMDGFKVEVGNTIEEWFINFVSPEDYDETGATDRAPARPNYQKATYSERLGRKKFKTTVDMGTIQKAFSDRESYDRLIMSITKRLYDSLTLYLNDCKRHLIGTVCAKLESVATDTAFAKSKAYKAGDRVQGGVILEDMTTSQNTYNTLTDAVKAGKAVALDLVTSIAVPANAETGEAFIKSVKTYAEKFSKPAQGYSYNGNIAGKAPKYILLIKDGVMPSVEVDTIAGAFHAEELAFPAEVHRVKDFGDSDCFALLIDERAMKLHNAYRAVRESPNGDGDFMNYILHDDEIAYFSPNCMMHAWKAI